MSYQYTFHYQSGRRAAVGFMEGTEKDAAEYAKNLSIEKGRCICVREHTYAWYNDCNRVIGYYENGMKVGA